MLYLYSRAPIAGARGSSVYSKRFCRFFGVNVIRRFASGLVWALALMPLGLATAQSPAGVASAQAGELVEEVISIGSFSPRNAADVGGAVAVLTSLDIENRQALHSADLLRELPGVEVSRTGQTGGLTQARIRGAESNHTLVLIDGIEVNNPGFGSEFDFANLLAFDIGRIELLRGPQSAMYGSDAIGGVISIQTRGAEEEGVTGALEAQAGSFDSTQYAARIAAKQARWQGSLSAARFETDGVSASALEPERDGFENTTLHGKLQVELSDAFRIVGVLRQSDGEVDTDTQDFAFPSTPTQGLVIDANQRTEADLFYGRLAIEGSHLDGRWLQSLSLGYTEVETDNLVDGAFSDGNTGERELLSYETSYRFDANEAQHTVSLGLQREELEFENRFVAIAGANFEADDDQSSAIVSYALRLNSGFAASISARHDRNDRFDDATTVRGELSYQWRGPGLRIHASAGEGVTNPSFFELFGFTPGSFVGNPNLEPEKSVGFDVGIERTFFDGTLQADLTYFEADLTDEIATVFSPVDFSSTAENQRGDSERRGVELRINGVYGKHLSYALSYTYLDAEDPDGRDEVRRAEHIASLNLDYAFAADRGNLNLTVQYNGDQEDSEFIFATPIDRVNLDAYTLVNLVGRYKLTDQLEGFARAENLFDEDYQEVFGFRSVGRAGYVGLRYSF